MAIKKTTKKAAETKVETPAEVKAEAKTVVAETKAVEVKEAEVKETKTAAKTEVKKAPVKKAAEKKTAVKEAVILQFAGKEVDTADIMKNVKDIWTKVLKNKAGDMKSVSLYFKPEESAAYYVINGDVTGKIEL